MARVRVRTVIDAPPERVWAALEDVGSHVDWMEDAVAIHFRTPQRAGVGTAFDCETKVGPLRLNDRMTITAWEPGRTMGVRHEGLVSGEGRFTLGRASGGRTWFGWDERLRFPAWLGGPVTGLAARPVLAAIWRRNLRNLKSAIEEGPGEREAQTD